MALAASSLIASERDAVRILLTLTISQTTGSILAAPFERLILSSNGVVNGRNYLIFAALACTFGFVFVHVSGNGPGLAALGATVAATNFVIRCQITSRYRITRLTKYGRAMTWELASKVVVVAGLFLVAKFQNRPLSAHEVLTAIAISQVLLSGHLVLTNQSSAGSDGFDHRETNSVSPRIIVQILYGVLSLLQLTILATWLSDLASKGGITALISFILLRGPLLLAAALRPQFLSQPSTEEKPLTRNSVILFAFTSSFLIHLLNGHLETIWVPLTGSLLGAPLMLIALKSYRMLRDAAFARVTYLGFASCAMIMLGWQFGHSEPEILFLGLVVLVAGFERLPN